MMYGLFCGVVLIALQAVNAATVCDSSIDTSGTTRILLDTCLNQTSLLSSGWTAIDGDRDGNTWETGSIECAEVETCSANTTEQMNWLITAFIDAGSALSNISIEVYFIDGACTTPESPDLCTTDFSLHVYPRNESSSDSTMFTNYVSLTDMVVNGSAVIYNGLVDTSSTGFYLGFLDMAACVRLTRVQVTYTVCVEALNTFATYPEVPSGDVSTGVCVDNTVTSSVTLTAQCNSAVFDFASAGTCECLPGYGASGNMCNACAQGSFKAIAGDFECVPCPDNSNNTGGANTNCTCNQGYIQAADGTCSECAADYFLANNGVCNPCPMGSSSMGGTQNQCVCDARLNTISETTDTTSEECNRCMANSYRSSTTATECTPCPTMSIRDFSSNLADSENVCFCTGNRATPENSPNTTSSDCTGCVNGFFISGSGVCVACPSNSNSMQPDDMDCTCNSGTLLEDEGTITTIEPCSGCNAGFYKLDTNSECTSCPANSVREAPTDDESICPCISTDYRRRESDSTAASDCLPVLGFMDAIVNLVEGGTFPTSIVLAMPSDEPIGVPIANRNSRDIEVPFNVPIDPGDTIKEFQISSTVDNDIALENEKEFILEISITETPFFVVGGITESVGEVYSMITVFVQDDDLVQVGFLEPSITLNKSDSSVTVTIKRNQNIATNLNLTITGFETAFEFISPVIMSPTEVTVNLTLPILTDIRAGDQTVTLLLEYIGPLQFNQFVILGGGDTERAITITILDDTPSSGFPIEAIIGVVAGGAGLAVLLLLIIILCLCICRLRVNRQGFYPTYEDKTSEPPTMLRYSASLRSISSQTVIPVTEGRAVIKENEFYV